MSSIGADVPGAAKRGGARTGEVAREWSEPGYQAFRLLHLGFVVAPILAGADKFLNVMTQWDQYLWSGVPALTGLAPGTFMMIVGVVEIVAGVLVAFRPRIGGLVVGAWLLGIIVNLLLVGSFFDVALRDLGLALGAVALARLAASAGE